jgi:hypothetical protein
MPKPAKNTICLWYDRDAEEAARFYAKTFPDSSVGAVHRAPGDFPSGKQGDVLTVDFTVMGIPCLGLNGGPGVKHNWERRPGKRVRLVQGQMGTVLADHPDRPDPSDHRPRPRRRQARVRRDDDDEKDRHRHDRGGPPRLRAVGDLAYRESPALSM